MSDPKFVLTNNVVTVVLDGKSHNVRKGAPNYVTLRAAVLDEDWDAVKKNLTVEKSVKEWAKGKFTLEGNNFYYEGQKLPDDLNSRILKMATGNEDPTPLFNFWVRLQRNPSMRSVKQLFPFLNHQGIPFTPAGRFLAYKGVRLDYKDQHSGTVSNKPGTVNKMPRNQISDDPQQACHEGFHVGDLSYARSFAAQVVVCEVDPEHVVCVPYDESQRKMRVCEYRVLGNHNGSLLPSTTFEEDKTIAAKEEEAAKVSDTEETPDNNEGTGWATSEKDDDKVRAAPKKPKTGKEKKKDHKAKRKAGKKVVQLFERLDKLGMEELLNESIDTLRAYAGQGLKIVGASKIPGGKVALIGKILQFRKKA